jgi:multicomponent Na+:H+ antiporter subunit G
MTFDAVDLDAVLDLLSLILILCGALLCLIAAIGLLRLRDVPSRLHAATKPQVFGLMLICLAVSISLREWHVIAFLATVVVVQFATAPLSAHMVGRQAYRNGRLDTESLVVDELRDAGATDADATGDDDDDAGGGRADRDRRSGPGGRSRWPAR